MKIKNREIRSFNMSEFESDGTVIKGYAVVLNQTMENYGYKEVMASDCLDATDITNVSLLVNHDDSIVPLARYQQGKDSTMQLRIDEKGLYFEAELDIENNIESKKVISAIKRNDLSSMSFAFTIADAEYVNDVFVIKKIEKIYEVSVVTEPAYSGTSVDLRSKEKASQNKKSRILRGIYNVKK